MSVAATPDDLVLPFTVEALDVRGRVVRLGPALDTIITKHGYPPQVCRVLGEALALTALLGSALKLEGRFQLQTKTDGVIGMVVVDYEAPDCLRAYARFDAAQLEAAGPLSSAALMGHGHLALTIDRGGDMSRYQGVVVLNGEGFEAAAHHYFQQSEQIPTLVRLAVAEHISAQGRHWRAGGLMAQFLPHSPERRAHTDLHPGDAPAGTQPSETGQPEEDDSWTEASALISTVEDHELTDPLLAPEHLLYRLFHERGATVFETMALRQSCRCSRSNILTMLSRFSPQDCQDMIDTNGRIGVTCEFCSTHYDIDPAEVTSEPA